MIPHKCGHHFLIIVFFDGIFGKISKFKTKGKNFEVFIITTHKNFCCLFAFFVDKII